MNNKELIYRLAKLQVLAVRWIERNTSLKIYTLEDFYKFLIGNKFTCTYISATANLKEYIYKYCRESKYLMQEIEQLQKDINTSNIKNLRFGLSDNFSNEEYYWDVYNTKCTLYMLMTLISIKEASQELKITTTAIKQACQQERLLNTKKVGKTWLVHLPECEAYWNITKDTDKKKFELYKNFKY